MDTLKKYLNIVAVVLILAALAAATVWPYRNVLILGLGAAGLLALAAYMLLHLPALKQGFRRRSFIYSATISGPGAVGSVRLSSRKNSTNAIAQSAVTTHGTRKTRR